jgi:hypothetical protein
MPPASPSPAPATRSQPAAWVWVAFLVAFFAMALVGRQVGENLRPEPSAPVAPGEQATP